MGFNSTASTLNLIAKLTPLGRQKLVSRNNTLITNFGLGDSDANYYANYPLTTGQVPASAGEIGPSSTINNGVTNGVYINSLLVVNVNGILTKPVEINSVEIVSETVFNGQTTVSGTGLTRLLIDRNNYNTDSLVNLYNSFGLPLNSTDDSLFTGTTYTNGGYSDTAYSALSVTNIGVIGIDNTSYGEALDGKSIQIVLPTVGGTYTIYSTFQNNSNPTNVEDANVKDTTTNSTVIGNNVAFLFSDDILTPNGGDITLSWSTGYDTNRPFSVNGKQLFNFQTNTNLGLNSDTIVGVAYLDKGIIVITNPTIVNDMNLTDPNYGVITGSTVSFNSISTDIYQNVTCIANRGEFGSSTNKTFGSGNNPRITEVGLYDDSGDLIALAKSDRQIVKNVNEFLAIGVKISL